MASYSSYSPPSSPLLGRLPHQSTQDSLATKEGSDDSDDDDGIVSINLLDDTPSFSLLHQPREQHTPTAIRAAATLFSNNHDTNNTPPLGLQINDHDGSLPPSSTSSSSPQISPATQTLNNLSQPTDLRYDMSQLEMDVATGLAQAAAKSSTNRATTTTTPANTSNETAKSAALFHTNKETKASLSASTGPPKQRTVFGEQPNGDGCNTEDDHASNAVNVDDNDDNEKDGNDVTKGTPVCQVDPATNRVIATFVSVRQASLNTRVTRHRIGQALLDPQQVPVDGYIWRRRSLQQVRNKHTNDNGGDDDDDDSIAAAIQPAKARVRKRDHKDRNRGTSDRKDKPKSNTKRSSKSSTPRVGKRQLPQPLQQIDPKTGKVIATFTSITKAVERTKLNREGREGLSKALDLPTGDPATIVGGYLWRRHVTDTATTDTSAKNKSTTNTTTNTTKQSSIVLTGRHDIEDHDRDGDDDNDDHHHKSKNRIATKETAKQARSSSGPSTSTPCTMMGDYSIHYVTVHETGPLGLSIVASKPPSDLCGAFECPEQANTKCCTVHLIMDPSIAGDAGVQKGDWFLDTDTASEAIPGLNTYASVLEVAQQAQRPLTFCLARHSKAESVSQPKKKTSKSTVDLQEPSSEDEASSDRKQAETATALQRKDSSLMPPPTAAATVTSSSTAVLSRRNEPSQESFGFLECSNDTKAVPFCALCSGRRTLRPVHHAWCPEHATFDTSGAAEILERIQQGVLMHCGACIQEFKDGRLCKGAEHSKECQRNQKMLDAIHAADSPPPSPKRASVKKRKPEGSPKKLSRSSAKRVQTSKESEALRPTTLRGREIHNSEKSLESEANMSDTGSDDGSHSAYDGGRTSRRPIHILTVAKKADKRDSYKTASTHSETTTKKSSVLEQGTANNRKETNGKESMSTLSRKVMKSSSKTAPKKTVRRSNRASNAGTSNGPSAARRTSVHQTKGTSKRAAGAAALQPKRTVTPHCHSDYDAVEVEVDDQTDDAIDVTWESCVDPWGPEGHVDGDVVLFAHTSGLGHHETLLPSARYEADPFSSSKRYGKTHRTPEDGFQALILKRDPLVTRPWGFTCQRHEFGGACLVTSVDPLSPADAAVYLGAASEVTANSELRVNDMIVSINGKNVGGMSEAGFEIEVEISGPELILLVSRYKFASKVQDRIQKAERSYLDAIDKVINDETLLGWTDIGATSTTTLSEAGVSANLESAAGKPKVSPQTINARDANGYCSGESVELVKTARVEDDTNLIRGFVGYAPSHMEAKFGKAGEYSPSHQGNKQANPELDCRVPEETTRTILPQKTTPEGGAEECSRSQGSMSEVVEEDCAHSQGSMPSQNDLTDDQAEECAQSQGSELSQKTTPETDEQECASSQRSETIKGGESDWEDDGNAWLGCVCGVIHNENVSVFWIQCDTCQSWYNVSEECAGLGAKDAEKVERWICWGCPCSDLDGDNFSVTNTSVPPQSEVADLPIVQAPTCDTDDSSRDGISLQRMTGDGCMRPKSKPRKYEDGTYAQPAGPIPAGFRWHKERGLWSPKEPKHKQSPCKLQIEKRASSNEGRSVSRERSTTHRDSQSEDMSEEDTQPPSGLTRGDVVFIEEHGWKGVNNASGIAHVLESHVDDDGDLLYDVKYIIGGTAARGVFAEYVSLHNF